jgi:purine-binding chemotaxis protein CheW
VALAAATQQLVVFALAGEHYALPIARVSEIIRATAPRGVAADSPWIRGVIGLRGRIIPIYDLLARLGVASTELGADGKIVIVDTNNGPVGVMVDNVEEVLTVPADRFEPVPATTSGSFDAIARIGDRLVLVLDVTELFDT